VSAVTIPPLDIGGVVPAVLLGVTTVLTRRGRRNLHSMFLSMLLSSRIISVVIASLSLAMTVESRQPKDNLL
jgi:hypothetical protein